MPTSKGEEATRAYFERQFNKKFPKAHPEFLKNDQTGKCLELDGYCPELKIAFEYNGKQHYKRVPKFQPNVDDFEKQVWHDRQKQHMCAKQGVALFVVPDLDEEKKIRKYLDTQFAAFDCVCSDAEKPGCFVSKLLPAKLSSCSIM
jgi:hypothetical protein